MICGHIKWDYFFNFLKIVIKKNKPFTQLTLSTTILFEHHINFSLNAFRNYR